MRIFANENLYDPIIEYLRSKGHIVQSVSESGLFGTSDDKINELAVKGKQVIITMDKDFTKTVRFPPSM